MSLLFKQLAQFAVKKLASSPEARQKASEIAQVVVQEAKQINAQEDRVRATGKAFSKAMRTFKAGAEPPTRR